MKKISPQSDLYIGRYCILKSGVFCNYWQLLLRDFEFFLSAGGAVSSFARLFNLQKL